MILHTRRSSNRNDGEKVLSCVLLHVIRLSRVAQLIVSRRVAGIRVGLLALLAYHFDVVASIPRYLVIKILPVLILKPAIPSKLQQHVFQSPPPRVRSNDSALQKEKNANPSFIFPMFSSSSFRYDTRDWKYRRILAGRGIGWSS